MELISFSQCNQELPAFSLWSELALSMTNIANPLWHHLRSRVAILRTVGVEETGGSHTASEQPQATS